VRDEALVVAGETERVLAVLRGTLTAIEQERAAAFRRDRDRRDFVAAHLLVRHCAAAWLGEEAGAAALTLVQHCDVHGPGHGRPSIAEAPEVTVSLTHTRGYVCAVAGRGRAGVDAEHAADEPPDDSLAAMVLTPAERALVGADNRRLIRQWVRKEALVKRGELALDRLREMDLSALPLDGRADPLTWDGRHLLEWASGSVLATAITDTPARLRLVGT
jgi:4'-phosphopantetheinyl transferase